MAVHLCWRLVKTMLESDGEPCKKLLAALPKIGSHDSELDRDFAIKVNQLIRILLPAYVPSERYLSYILIDIL
jgi:hypothetical protein